MTALLSARLGSALLASLGCLALHATASACAGEEAAPRWNPERSWPAACEPDIPLDGFVLLAGDALDASTPGGEGSLEIVVERVVEGAAVESFPGTLSYPNNTAALFRSERAFAAQADYQISARRLAPSGEQIGELFSSKFTTGTRSLSALSFRSAPTLRAELGEKALEDCSTDSCGVAHCEPRKESVSMRFVRVAVPAIDGGIEQLPYRVTAALSLNRAGVQAARLATPSDTAATQAGKRSFLVLEVPNEADAAEACVTLTVSDVAGHELVSEPVCTALPESPAGAPSAAAAPDAPETTPRGDVPAGEFQAGLQESRESSAAELSDVSYTEGFDALTADEQEAALGGEGCAIGRTGAGGAGKLGWLALALTLARLRARKRSA